MKPDKLAKNLLINLKEIDDEQLAKRYVELTFSELGIDDESRAEVLEMIAQEDGRFTPKGEIYRFTIPSDKINSSTSIYFGAKAAEIRKNKYKVEVIVSKVPGGHRAITEQVKKQPSNDHKGIMYANSVTQTFPETDDFILNTNINKILYKSAIDFLKCHQMFDAHDLESLLRTQIIREKLLVPEHGKEKTLKDEYNYMIDKFVKKAITKAQNDQ
jgi:hypothetical protein